LRVDMTAAVAVWNAFKDLILGGHQAEQTVNKYNKQKSRSQAVARIADHTAS